MELDVDFAFDSDEFNTIFSGDNILLSFNKLSSPEPPTPTSSSMQKATEPTQQEDRKKGKDAERPTTTDELSERVVAPSNAQDLSTARDEPTPSSNQVVSAIIAPVSIAHVADHQDSSDNKENNPETKATHTITSKISFSHNNLLDDMLKLDTKWCELPSTSPDSKEPTAPTSHPRPMDPLLSSSSSSQMVRKGSPLSLIRNGYLSSKIRGSMPALSTGSSVTTAAATAAAVAVSAVKSTSSTTDNNSNLGGEKSRDSGSRASLPFAKLSDIGKRISRWMVKRS
ncbi:hypothetical protein EV182_006670 [Spiromyces aspiralis]|uniref:Uncharacterized protein n=1 Tax=Spiromyces aspiralis TaxID=68401 RepID=A0ACC1HPZ1_9FUNG|nr:hypothetical protein EV182_006670 [Spiromyces aspiralis]